MAFYYSIPFFILSFLWLKIGYDKNFLLELCFEPNHNMNTSQNESNYYTTHQQDSQPTDKSKWTWPCRMIKRPVLLQYAGWFVEEHNNVAKTRKRVYLQLTQIGKLHKTILSFILSASTYIGKYLMIKVNFRILTTSHISP